ncbi:MAG: trypsin-like serine protease, partial [Polyangiaceae bacterium]|nr:trypsin-like serine protease [Polyangiaceae bacterium]
VTSELRPCRGDSGGPLLTLDGMIVGVLSRGSMSCDGRDEFVLLAPIAEWIGLTMEFSSGQARMEPSGAIRPGESRRGLLAPDAAAVTRRGAAHRTAGPIAEAYAPGRRSRRPWASGCTTFAPRFEGRR